MCMLEVTLTINFIKSLKRNQTSLSWYEHFNGTLVFFQTFLIRKNLGGTLILLKSKFPSTSS